ncbi:9092_t:CDS:2 [Entrophospora sp. SA101]|nr:9092_t:CDS:2 [Entrophospora sp. SA101]
MLYLHLPYRQVVKLQIVAFKPENILVTDFGLAKKLTGAPELMKGYNASYQADRQLGNNHLRNVNRKHANDFDLNSNNEEAELSLRPD